MSGLCAAAPAAHAEPSDDPREQARELMRAGNERYRNGDLKGARESYQRAFATAKSFDVACNLGRTEMELRLFRDAAEHLDYCVRFHILSSKPEMMLNEQEAREKLRTAKARVGSLWISAEPSGAEIWIDSQLVGRAPLIAPVFVDPGPHEIRVTSPQFAASTTRVAANAGAEQTIKVQLSPETSSGFEAALPGSVFPTNDQPQRKRSSWGVVPWLSGGLSLVGIGVGAGFLVVAHGKESDKQDVLSSLPEAHPCAENTPHVSECGRVRQLAQDARTAQAVGYTSLGVGVAAAVTTAVLLLQSPHSTTTASKRHAPQARVVPTVSSDRLFVSLDARF